MKRRTRILFDAVGNIADNSTQPLFARIEMGLLLAICEAASADETEIGNNPILDDAIEAVATVIQSRHYDSKDKLKVEDIEHCPPSNSDWLVAFDKYSLTSQRIKILSQAIAQSEPCSDCGTVFRTSIVSGQLVTDEVIPLQIDGIYKVVCHNCRLFYS